MKRRNFIKGGLATTGLLAVPSITSMAGCGTGESLMPMTVLGRTGIKVSKLGFGCAPLGWDTSTQDGVSSMLLKAVDLGINYFDTAPNYGNAEVRMGEVIPSIRDKIVLISKTEEPDYDGTWRLLEQSLKRLRTEYLDIVHIHNFGSEDRFPDMNFTLSDKGSLGALRMARKQGLVRFIGASGHLHPSRFHLAIENPDIDILMLAVNFVLKHKYNFEDKIWLRASQKNMGLAAMKVYGGSVKKWDSKITDADRENALRYALTLPGLSTAVIGLRTEEQLVKAVNDIKRLSPLSEDELHKLAKKGLDMSRNEEWMRGHGAPYI